MEDYPELTTRPWRPSRLFWVAVVIIDTVMVLGLAGYFLSRPPAFAGEQTITVLPGSSASEIATQLDEADVVRSADLLYGLLVVWTDSNTIAAGEYTFSEPLTVFAVAEKITTEVPLAAQISLTFPEGFSVRDFNQFLPAHLATSTLPDLLTYEGTLFPDTYFVPKTYSAEDIRDLLHNTYLEKTAPFLDEIEAAGLTLEEVIILASIVEREANDETSMKRVAGILFNRLAIGMALQVDASVAYGLNKSGVDLTRADLETDGPFNTYTRPGLPPAPIANPGLDAITAVLNPAPSDDFYYITGNDGNFYYAETLNEHNRNVARYLR